MARKGLSLLMLFVLAITFGCSAEKKETPPEGKKQEDKTASTSSNSDSRALTETEQKLTGVWLGAAFLQEDLVEAEFEAKSTDEDKLNLVNEAEAFLSTVVAIHFKPDGTFEQDIELSATGARQTGAGTWRVTDAQGDQLVVQTIEHDAEGNEVTAKYLYQFKPDGNGFAMPAPVVASLANCNPQLVFARQNDFSDARTAEGSGDDITR